MIKRILRLILNVIFTCIGVLAISFGTMYLLGIKPLVVTSGSMEPTIQTGSISLLNTKGTFDEVEIGEKDGDIIAFQIKTGATVIHRAIGEEEGIIVTKGDNNDNADGPTTTADNFLGHIIFSIPVLGYIFAWITTKKGIIITVTVMIFLLLADFLLSDDKSTNENIKGNTEDNKENAKENTKEESVKTTKENDKKDV